MRLQYEIAARDNGQLRALLRGVEKEARASNKRMAQDAQRTAAQSARAASGPMFGPGRKEQMAQIRANERAAITSARNELRARLANEKELARARESLDRQRARGLMQQFTAQQRAERQALTARRRTADRIGSGIATSLGGAVGGTLRAGGAAAGLAGGFAAAGALREHSEIRRMSAVLANQAGTPHAKDALAAESTRVKGFTGSETLTAMSEFVTKTGDLDAARAMIQDMGQLALASATDLGELGGAAGHAFNVIRDTIKDPKQQIIALNDVMRTLAAQGNLGAVEIKDMVMELGGLGAATRRFDGGATGLIKTMGAMAQASVARGGAATAAEATTAVTRFADDIIKDTGGAFGKHGVDRFTDKTHTKLRAPEDIMVDVLEKSGGDLEKVSDMFGVFAQRAVGGFAPLFVDAQKNEQAAAKREGRAVNRNAGKDAVLKEFARFRDASVDPKALKERAASALEEPDRQAKEAMKEFNTAVGRELMPAVITLAREMVKLVPLFASAARMLAKFVGFMAENPWTGIAALVGAAMVKDFIAANIGNAVKAIISGAANQVLKRGGGTIDPETGEMKMGGKMAAAGMGAAIGISIASAIITAGVVNFEKSEADMSAEGAKLNAVRESKDREFVKQQLQEQRKRVDKLKAPGFVGSVLGDGAQKAVDFALDPNKQTELNTAQSTAAEMEKRLALLEREAKIAAMQEEAAKSLKEAGKSFAAKGGPEASRTAPIISPARTGGP